jgi:DNA adenine methylase
MRYWGGKVRIAKKLTEFINSELEPNQTFIDMFCGSCNVISKIDSTRVRIANDLHENLILLHKAVQLGVELPDTITEEQYKDLKQSPSSYLKGFAGFGCSFSGQWFGGYAKDSTNRNYCLNAKNSLLKKHSTLKDVLFTQSSYEVVTTPVGAYIYCDIPYKETTQYSTGAFNHTEFYEWAEAKSRTATVRVSEYSKNVPEGWEVVFSTDSKKDIRNGAGVQEKTTEVLIRKVGSK